MLFGWLGVNAQPASFYKVFSGNGYDKGEGVVQLLDSSYLITGSSSSFEDAPSQVFLLNIDKNGEYLWSKAYGGAEFEEGKRVFSVDNFGHFVLGTSTSGPSQSFDGYAMFTNPAGDLQWEKYFDKGRWERVHNAVMLADTSIVAVGETDSTVTGEPDFFMFRIDKTGSLLWSKKWGTDGVDVLNGIVAVSDTSYVICGTKYVEDSLENKGYLAKFYADGTVAWDTVFGNRDHTEFMEVRKYNGELMAVGSCHPTGSDYTGLYRSSVSLTGNLNFQESYTPTHDLRYLGLVQYTAGAGKFFTAVQQIDPGIPTYPNGEDAFIYRYDSGFSWDGYGVSYSGEGQDQTNQMIATLDGYALIVGFHSQYGYGGNSIFVVKIGDAYNFPYNTSSPIIYDLVDLIEKQPLIDCQAFPNPFADQLTVRLPEGQSCSIELVDQQGRRIETFMGESGELKIRTSELPQGTYFLKVSSDSGAAVIKLVK